MSGTDPAATDGPRPGVPQAGVKGVGEDPREQDRDVAEAPGKIWFRDLDEAVIEADRCIQCASCVAACPSDSIGIDEDEGRPTLVKMCTGCSRCWDFCPRSGLRYERHLELTQAERGLAEPVTYAARATDEAADAGQDGGVVTALLTELIEAGEIDGAIVAREREDEPLRGEAVLATSREELLAAVGSVYNQTMGLGQVDELLADADLGDDPDLALVGTPCMIQGATALDRYDHEPADPIALTVALMCTRSFEHSRLVSRLETFDVDPDAVDTLDISDGQLRATDAGGETLLETDVDAFDAAGLRGCDECADFVGGAADISVGNVGSPDGETTVVVRTETGESAWETAAPDLEAAAIDRPGTLEKLADWNRRRAESILPREYDPEAGIGISYEHHRESYDGTDREPEPLNPARVHQYEEWC
ncbi:coenzyme F420 hydrogenase/dehydrogenase subunit beta domain-containing protein [Natrinema pellirubrum DSM 15624]|uniref:Coenzyme F420 hydrogenase/dehydrogenase subunit beta domain-containing protein n=1 Tax=Natrinema pellirubrum (strain DSM 15624 / CIP 106293 / JCM 10476 / NCIMB 786 / 157) TaxID=797303 RepID=L0JH55_NATP1|nr:Coenzyme F420 hydrogenase/dehydrogenase, beta subunit C-terminal domain [Natrinema pellirubrum]AGB30649.1 coenzyme F420-reducing hydrogenase, beta subunit [Natrinema pellirubrum DSM 15624]ELY74875.1 coenzyme F420 hydrogenase/dehydrogenase subunit beta domain-containing protein [Natrinema pellirubrum DSM 15624]